jgi:pimeloyl-ACP methyl ester carboxylesterase
MNLCATSQGPIYYELVGAGPPLILLHSDGASGREFAPVVETLARGHRVLLLDLPGCGRSPRRAFSIEYYEENAKAALDAAHKLLDEPVRVVGVGGGGVCALWMGILAPKKVRAIVADSFAEFYDADDVRRDLACHRDPTPEMVSYFREMNGDDWRTVIHELDRLFAQMAEERRSVFDWRLEEVAVPVSLTVSRRDHLVKDAARRMLEVAEQIPSAKLVVYPAGDHPSMWSNQAEFWDEALRFLARSS